MDCDLKDLAALLERVRAGDADAAALLVERLHPVVMPVIQRRLPRTLAPEDMAQEVYLKIFHALPGYRGGVESFAPWCRRIAFTTCLNQLRRERRRPELRWSELSPEQAAALESAAQTGDTGTAEVVSSRDLITRLLDELPPPERVLIQLVDLEQRALGEVQALTGWSAVNIRVRCFRARRRLRQILRRLHGDHE